MDNWIKEGFEKAAIQQLENYFGMPWEVFLEEAHKAIKVYLGKWLNDTNGKFIDIMEKDPDFIRLIYDSYIFGFYKGVEQMTGKSL